MRTLVLFLFLCGSYTHVFSQWKTVYPMSSPPLDVAVADPNYVFLLVWQPNTTFLQKSSDGARTWKLMDVGNTEELTSIFFTDSLTGFVTSYKGVYKTVDGARTWQLYPLPENFPVPSDLVFISASVGYLRSANNRLAKTTNGGNTWAELPSAPQGTPIYGNSFSFFDTNTGYVISDMKLFATKDGGSEWTPMNLNYNVTAVYAVNQTIAYASAGSMMFKTENAGETWSHVSHINAKFMHFKNADEGLLFEDYSDVYKITEGGTNITNVYNSEYPFSWYQISFSGDFGCALGGDRAIVTTQDGGASWKLNQIYPQHGQFRDVHFTSSQEGFVIGEDRGVIRTDDNAVSWYYDENHFDRDDLYQMAFAHPDTGIFVVTNNYAFTTYDGGQSMFLNEWNPPIIGHLQSFDYEMINSKIMYTVGSKVKVAKSIDGGKSWSSFEFTFSNSLNAIKCLDANTCHAAGSVGKVVSTWDGGAHWKVHDLDVNSDLTEVFLLDENLGFIGGRSVILRTDNGGQTWTIMPINTGWSVISFHFITPVKAYAVTNGGEVFRTENAGQSWTLKQGTGIPDGATSHYFTKTFMRDTTHIYGISESNIYRWTQPPPEPDVVTGVDEESHRELSVYPNPTVGRLRVVSPSQVEGIAVIDLHGILLQTYEARTEELDLSDLSPGMYLVRVKRSSGVQVNKIIKR